MMQVRRLAELGWDGLAALLTKPPFDAVTLGPKAQERIRASFGRDLTAQEVVQTIVQDVRQRGDEALFAYTHQFDGANLTAQTVQVTDEEFAAAAAQAEPAVLEALKRAAANVRRFHVEQMPRSWMTNREHGSMLGQLVQAVERVGIYVPGGTAAYPSSVLMNAIPAVVAGVQEIVMVVPPASDGTVHPYVLCAAREAGVHKVFKCGGAQAVAALAFGTGSIPKVDKITGPGNIFVTLAKKEVYGHVDIDMLAGPSEILVIADATADPRYIAADLLSQAEHDVLASSILVTDSEQLIAQVEQEVERQLAALPRQEIAREALSRNGLLLLVDNLQQAIEAANISAPEHLEIITADPFAWLPFIRNAGAVFLGPYSPEPLGDYFAGPNHVLPTGGTARFYSVLNVETFMKKTSIISYTRAALEAVMDDIVLLADKEGLEAHANAVRIRREQA